MKRNQHVKLQSIEVCRGIAAILVVFYHIQRHFEQNIGYFPLTRITEFGHIGVDFFFVLSGFIILYIHKKDIGNHKKLKDYLLKRFIRLYPIYWIALIFYALLIPFVNSVNFPSTTDLVSNILIQPGKNYQLIIDVAWTLKHEILFYILFCTLIFKRNLGIIILATWFSFTIIQYFIYPIGFEMPTISSSFNLQFLMGMMTAYILLTKKLKYSKAVFTTGVILLLTFICLELQHLLDGYASEARVAYGISFCLLIIGLVMIETRRTLEFPKLALVFGSASYSIYLSHFFFSGVIYKILEISGIMSLASPAIMTLIVIAISIFLGVQLSIHIEIPIIKYLRKKLL